MTGSGIYFSSTTCISSRAPVVNNVRFSIYRKYTRPGLFSRAESAGVVRDGSNTALLVQYILKSHNREQTTPGLTILTKYLTPLQYVVEKNQ